MSDEFLYRLREPPRPEFAEALRERILREPPRSPTGRRIRAGLVVLLAALIIAACAAPQTRTPILQATQAVVTQGREVVTRFVLIREEAPPLVIIFPCSEGNDVQVESLSVREAQKRVPFQIHVPTWVPEGLEMNPVTLVHPEGFGDWVVYIEWRGKFSGGKLFPEFGEAPLSLKIEGPGAQQFWVRCVDQLRNARFPVEIVEATPSPVELRTLEINGKATSLTVMREETPYPSATLRWVREEDNVSYTLTANLDMVSLEDLIRAAETIR